jgi:hypothetical protein
LADAVIVEKEYDRTFKRSGTSDIQFTGITDYFAWSDSNGLRGDRLETHIGPAPIHHANDTVRFGVWVGQENS